MFWYPRRQYNFNCLWILYKDFFTCKIHILKKDTSFINSIKGMTLRIYSINAMYSASVVLKFISVCNLLHHITEQTVYVITYTICDMTFYALSESDLAHPPANLESK